MFLKTKWLSISQFDSLFLFVKFKCHRGNSMILLPWYGCLTRFTVYIRFLKKTAGHVINRCLQNARAFSRVSYFLYFFCFSHMFCGKKVVVVFLWNHIHICMPSFWFFIFVCNEKFHRNIKILLLIIQFCLCILNTPRSKYFIKFSLMVDSEICSANTIPQVRSCWLITH